MKVSVGNLVVCINCSNRMILSYGPKLIIFVEQNSTFWSSIDSHASKSSQSNIGMHLFFSFKFIFKESLFYCCNFLLKSTTLGAGMLIRVSFVYIN